MTPQEVQKRLQELFEKFKKPLNERKLTDDDKKFIAELITLYNSVKKSNLTFSESVALYEKQVKLAELEKVFYEEDTEFISEVRDIQVYTAEALKREIMLLSSRKLDEATEKELEQKKAFFLELRKAIKTNDEITAGFEKAEELTRGMVAATLGITKAYNFGSESILGSIKGFAKGLAKSVHPMNMIGSAITRVAEQMMMLDNARASLFQDTGLSGFTDELVNISDELRTAYGPKAAEVSSQLTAEAQKTIKAFSDIRADGSATKIIALAGKFQKLGASASATFEINKFLNANLDFSGTQQADVLKQLLAQAKEMGRTPEEVFREMAESIPLYSRFRANFPSVFRGIALAARKTNISISDLQKLTESLDTTEDAMKKAAKFNALLGGEFLNGLELLEAKPGDKVKLIARAYQRAQAAQGEIHPRVLRALYKEFGMDASSFKKMVGAEFGRFEEELAVAPKPTKMKQIEADIQQTLTAQEKLDNAISKHISRITTFINNEFPILRRTVNSITDNIETVILAAAGMGAILSVGRMALGSRIYPKFIKPVGPGGFGGPDGPSGPVTGPDKPKSEKPKPRPKGAPPLSERAGYYDKSTGKFRDVYGKEMSEAKARESGLSKRTTRKPPIPSDPPKVTVDGPNRLRTRTNSIVNSARNMGKSMFEGMRGSLSKIRGGVSSGLSNVYKSTSSLSARATAAAGDFKKAKTADMTSALRSISDRAQKARSAIANFSERVSQSITGKAQSIRTAASTRIEGARDVLAKTSRNVITGVKETGTAVSRTIEDVTFEVKTKASRAASSISTGAQRAVATVTETAQAAGRGISTAARTTRDTVAKIGTSAAEKIRSLKPVQQFQKFLGKIPPTTMAKVLKGAGIIGSLIGVASVASVLMSDAPVEQKARELMQVGSGILGGVIGSVAGSLAGPLGTIVGGIGGALLGDYIGSTPAIQNAFLPTIMSLMPSLESEMVDKADATKITGESISKVEIEKTEPIEDTPYAMSVAPKIKAEFETSNDDDVLLQKLVMLKNNLEQIHTKENKVNLTVGFNKIATARMG